MEQIKGVLIDLGGVVYQGGAAIRGSIDAVRRLKQAGMPVRFLTNTTSQPLSGILAKLAGLGIEASREDLFTPAIAARTYILKHDLEPFYLISPALKQDFERLPMGSRPAVVIGDARDGFTYAGLNDAFRRLDKGAEFLALASNRVFIGEDGKPSLDVGAFVAALEYATGRTAVVLGKPSPAFFQLAVADMGLKPGAVAMIGDDAEFDVAAAIEAGLSGYLVQTGKWRPGTAERLSIRPTGEHEDLAAAVEGLLGHNA
ncbi:TIGR01458 family HAD-type hydrolase [Mesorhizobium sp. BAC0120]|uniref:TIGR01458 family HAD-type hydrolase n=1 Tax=Mesorhizobium sp. BAC0120 TaxID=3090670 RepID=UPI00298D4806|nr:TIGR01458 family HAD-type hydrolase [Mesorhizobium sp. BAC0120]MDW6021779.1 TIGR01458 family HAD-type hydrolase [Mesorhizobium sp. BAC0120]